MVELYYIHLRTGRAMPTGAYTINRLGKKKAVTKYAETYETDAGKLSPEQWRAALYEAIVKDKELEVLEVIMEYCREHCAWLHKESDIRDHAMNILAGRVFLCGNEHWKDVADKVKGKYFVFSFGR